MSVTAPLYESSETGQPPDWWLQCRGAHSTDAIYIDMPPTIEYRCYDCDRAVICYRSYSRLEQS